jgi:hypothetical protein
VVWADTAAPLKAVHPERRAGVKPGMEQISSGVSRLAKLCVIYKMQQETRQQLPLPAPTHPNPAL